MFSSAPQASVTSATPLRIAASSANMARSASDIGRVVTEVGSDMAKAPKAKTKPAKEIELVDDAWPRFEALVKSAAKMGHKPHNEETAKRKKRSTKNPG